MAGSQWRDIVIGLAAAALLVLGSLAFAGKSVPAPKLPKGAVELSTRVVNCPDGPLWRTLYDLTGDDYWAEIVTYGRPGSEVPLLWVYFEPDVDSKVLKAILTLPGQPAQEMTAKELRERYPTACYLPPLA